MIQPVSESLKIQELVDNRGDSFALELLTPKVSLDGVCLDPDVVSPGLALAGFAERFPSGRMQVFGQTEMMYLATLTAELRRERLESFFSQGVPVAFVTKGQEIPEVLLETAARHGVSGLSDRAHDQGFLSQAQALSRIRARTLHLRAWLSLGRLRCGAPLHGEQWDREE